MYRPAVSIIIRTLNDRDHLAALLDQLDAQDYPGTWEAIVVDTSSTDGTTELAASRGARVVSITQEEFSYPVAINRGMEAAAGEVAVITVGHAIPFSTDWLSSGVRHFADPQVAGVFAPPIARQGAPLFESLMYRIGYVRAWLAGVHVATPERWSGILGATNCIVRRSLWERHPFDVRYGMGGEDVAWARWAIAQGYRVICDWKFSVRHSHGNSVIGHLRQLAYWRSLGKPAPFRKEALRFRKDLRWGE